MTDLNDPKFRKSSTDSHPPINFIQTYHQQSVATNQQAEERQQLVDSIIIMVEEDIEELGTLRQLLEKTSIDNLNNLIALLQFGDTLDHGTEAFQAYSEDIINFLENPTDETLEALIFTYEDMLEEEDNHLSAPSVSSAS